MASVRRKSSITQREKSEIAIPLAKYFSNDSLEFPFKRSSFDLVSYDEQQNVLRIVECKVTSSLTSIGATFGQLLAYIALISSNGKDFLEAVHYRWHIPLNTITRMIESRTVPVEFYVAFRKSDVEDKKDFLEWAHEHFLDKKIGIILVDKSKCNFFKVSEKLDIPITSSYSSIFDAAKEIDQIIRQKGLIPNAKFRMDPKGRVIKYSFANESIHFEIWFSTRDEFIEVGLHIEASKNRNMIILNALRRKSKQVLSNLPDANFEKWGRNWTKVYERIKWDGQLKSLDDTLLNELAFKLKLYVDTMKPMLEEINWGKSTRSSQKEIVRIFIMGKGNTKRCVTTDAIYKHIRNLPEFSGFGNKDWKRGHSTWKAKQLTEEDPRHFRRKDKHTFCYFP